MFLSLLNVGIPCAYAWLTIFYLVFHAATNFFADITRFADRRFYSDWWNAGNLGEYWRKWNHPINHWLGRHVYLPLVRLGINSEVARLLTFLVSALAHEYIVIGAFRVINGAAFIGMAVNAPIMWFQKATRHTLGKNFNNQMFWLGYAIIGQPFAIMLCYY